MRLQRAARVSDAFGSEIVRLAEPAQVVIESPQDKQYSVPDDKIDWLTKRIDKLNKFIDQLNKRGPEFGTASPIPPVRLEVLNSIQIKTDRENVFVPGKVVKVHGQAPDVGGWRFAATLVPMSSDGETFNLVKAAPGAGPIPEEYRKEVPKCDFCKQARRRNETFLLKNANGEWKQIGRNCLGKFLGVQSPEQMADLATSLADLYAALDAIEGEGGEGGGGGGRERLVSIVEFIATVIALTRAAGWVPGWKAKQEEKASTAQMAFAYCIDKKSAEEIDKKVNNLEFRDEDKDLASKAIEWARGLRGQASETLDDYLWNLTAATSQPVVSRNTAGIVGSVISAYQRANSPVDTTKQGQGMYFRGKVVGKRSTKTGSTLWEFQNDAGEKVIWFDNQHVLDQQLDQAKADGSYVHFEGMIGKVSSYMGQQQTQVVVKRLVNEKEFFEGVKGQEEKAKKAEELKANAPSLAPGQKLKLRLTVVDAKQFESSYSANPTSVYRFIDEYGRKFFWKTSSGQEMEIGKTYDANVVVGWDKLPGSNKAKLDAAGNKALAYDKYDPQAVKLDKVDPTGVEGQAMVTKDDIKAKAAEADAAAEMAEKADNIQRAAMDQIREMSSGILADIPFGADKSINPQTTEANVAKVRAEIERAKQEMANGSVDFEPQKLNIWSIDGTFHEMRLRRTTPQDVVQIGDDRIRKAQEVIPQIQAFGPQLAQISAEAKASKNWSLSPEVLSKTKAILDQIETLGKGLPIDRPTAYVRVRFADDIESIAQAAAEASLDDGFVRMVDTARQASASGTTDTNWAYNLSHIYNMPVQVATTLPPVKFIEVAEGIIAKTYKAVAELPILQQSHAQLRQQFEALLAIQRQKEDELDALQSQRSLGKAKAWVGTVCLFVKG